MEKLGEFVRWVRDAEKVVNAEYSQGIRKAGSLDASTHNILLQHYFTYKNHSSIKLLASATLLLAVAVIILNIVSIILLFS